jgi:glyoxylase-like metal-dependent hydrolase (beta-lactamase superfamily II)
MTTFEVADGVTGIDVGMFGDGVGAVYLFDDEASTLVDAGTAAAADRIMAGLRECGVEPAGLSNLVLSHVHTDHAGAAADLVEAAPDLDVYIHEMTAPHLVDPSGLVESSRQAMGEHFAAMGEQGPVPESNVTGVGNDGTTLDIGTNRLELIYAPGHSPDHFAVWNPERRVLFAAECLGLYLADADRWLPPATLPNFDVALVDEAIDRLRGLDPEIIVFPHFGIWPDDPATAFERAERELHRFDERIVEFHEASGSIEATEERVRRELIDLGDAYDPRVESFFARLLTAGYLRHHGLD